MMGGGCTDFARCILVAFNIIFVFSGIGIFSVGLWLKADPNSVNMQKLISVDNLDEAISSTAYVLVGFGSLVFLVGLLGCIGGWKQWKWALGMYIFLVVIFLGEFSGGIMAAVYKSKLTSQLGNTLEKSIAKYKNSSIIREAWDEVQKTLHCCGVTTYMDYSKYAHFSNRWLILLHAQFKQDMLQARKQDQLFLQRGLFEQPPESIKSQPFRHHRGRHRHRYDTTYRDLFGLQDLAFR